MVYPASGYNCTPGFIGDGKVVVLTVCIKSTVDLPLILSIMQTSTIGVKVTLIRNTKNTTTPKEKNSIARRTVSRGNW